MNWTRDMVKGKAWDELGKSFWYYILAGVVAGVIITAPVFVLNIDFRGINPWVRMLIIWATIIFIDLPLFLGWMSCYLKAPYGERKLLNLFSFFRRGRYLAAVSAMLQFNLVLLMWGLLILIPWIISDALLPQLLFAIPLIIKVYQYRFVPYILSGSPDTTALQAIDISHEMTKKQVLKLVLLDLSFIFWLLLALLPFITIRLFVHLSGLTTLVMLENLFWQLAAIALSAYVYAAWAQLYFLKRDEYFAAEEEVTEQPEPSAQDSQSAATDDIIL